MRLVLHRKIPDDVALGHQWNALVMQMERPEMFYTYEWALAVARAYGALTPLLMLAYEKDSLVGVAALAVDGTQEKAVFIAGTTADYCDFVSQPRLRAEFIELVLNELRNLKIPLLMLANLPAQSATFLALPLTTQNQGYSLFSRPAFRCAQVVLSTPQQKELTKRAMQRKQMLRRHLKGMSKTAPVEIRHLKSWDHIAAALPRFEQAQISRFRSAGRVSNLASEQRRTFLAELANLLSPSGWVTLTCLNVGDEEAAWNYGFQFAGSWFWYQPAFNSRFERYYPGLCLLAKIVEEACETPEIHRVDLGLGTEGYKERFATGFRNTMDVTVTTSTARRLREMVRYHAASAIKSSPPLEHYVRRLLGRAQAGGV